MSAELPVESKSLLIARQAITYVCAVFAASSVAHMILGVTLPYVAETLAAIVGIAGVNTARNILVDGPVRRATVTATYGPPPVSPPPPPVSPSL